jgi:hypothetical protein
MCKTAKKDNSFFLALLVFTAHHHPTISYLHSFILGASGEVDSANME